MQLWLLLCSSFSDVALRAQACSAQTAAASGKRRLVDAVQVQPGATCLDKERVVAHLRMWTGDAPVSPKLRVRVVGDPRDRHRIAYDVDNGRYLGHREFNPAPSSCDELHAILGLALALALDAERIQQTWLEQHPRVPVPVIAALQLAPSYGVVLDEALGLQLGVEIGWTTYFSTRADLFAQWSWNNTIVGSRGQFDALLPAASLQVCTGGRPDPNLRLSICAGAAAGAIVAWGHGYMPNDADVGPWLAARSDCRKSQLG